tara:strand:- start:364 stop:483 length:120 start_codon:yes stop_codon:yes gene_type:complete
MCMVNVKEDGSFTQICNCKYGSMGEIHKATHDNDYVEEQ